MDIVKLRKLFSHLTVQNVPFKIIGVVAFGSRVKEDNTEHSDTDLLVVASGITAKRQRRGREIAILKNLLPPIPLDILLLTKKETISNFKNHNPLFLDIATEGIVILDSDKFLANIIEDTRNYLYNSKIQKIKDGWIFPAKAGVPTYLSKVSNEDFSKAMFKDGERDFEIGQKIKDETYFDKSVYHFQQAVEKFIKAIMIAMGVFKKTHFIGEELIALIDKGEVPPQWKEQLLEAAQVSEEIEPEVSLSRYPGISDDALWLPYEEYEELDATNALKKAEKVRLIANNFISEWFGFKADKPPINNKHSPNTQ